eukprot:TRINITY_DN22710_c0_g4_i1.p1 TRINITY_DN22710_c0_g4~~TRINITY_DN22710_c0_g4_i1.p1  ORF type:complete len:397 (+),score=83.03 TRINITY_DN22710_c0_g4_i1:76-1266(+)
MLRLCAALALAAGSEAQEVSPAPQTADVGHWDLLDEWRRWAGGGSEDWLRWAGLLERGQSDCAAPVLGLRMGGDGQGLFGKLLRVAGALGHAAASGLRIRPDPERFWVHVSDGRAGCGGGGLRCFSAAFPECPAEGEAEPRLLWSACASQNMAVYHRQGHVLPSDGGSNDFFGRPPADWAESALAWQALLFAFALRPQPWLAAHVAAARTRMAWPDAPVVGVQVRRGDKYLTGRMRDREVWHTVFLPAVEWVARSTGAQHVFLATDSSAVAREAAETLRRTGLRLLTAEGAERDYWQLAGSGRAGFNATAASAGALSDVMLLAFTDHFIGTHVSAVSKAALLLRYARMGPAAVPSTYWPSWADDNPARTIEFVFGSAIDSPAWGRTAKPAEGNAEL